MTYVRVACISVALLVFCFVGCDQQDATPKASHFEHDHDVAAHWPSDLADAASKIRERLVFIETGKMPSDLEHGEDHHHEHEHHQAHEDDPKSEIVDLVAWVPEVAADTNLSEADWLPLYQASQSLMASLRISSDLGSSDRSQIEAMCELIDDAIPRIPEQLASLKRISP